MRLRVQELFHAVADLGEEDRLKYFAENEIQPNTQAELNQLLSFDSRRTTSLEADIERAAASALEAESRELLCGAYRLGKILGSGGMGSVYCAQRVDGEIAHRVAVKLLRPGASDPELHERFLVERQILAILSHPNIAKLLDAGHRDDGQPYLVMEYIEGIPIDCYAAALGVGQKVTLFIKVCAAVSYLHRNLVIHRDLKPANILVTEDGEPKLLDFGIAKILEGVSISAATSRYMLTPDYASPEQASGGRITTASDIYSLGAVLYKLLTGRSPHQFEGDSPGAIASAISDGKITPPSRLAPGLRGDLEAVLQKALRKEPWARYATVDQLAEDLENCLEARPIRAHKGDAWYRARKFFRRHWLPAAAAGLALTGLSGGILVANHQRTLAERRFIQVRQLSSRLFDIDAEVRKMPGSTKTRELIVKTSLEYLQRLNEDAGGDASLAFELGSAYLSVARVQGVPIGVNLGHTKEADGSLQKAERLMASVLRAQPGNRTAISRSAQIAHDRMILAELRNQHENAMEFGRKAEVLLSRYERSGSVDRTEAEEVVRTYTNIGNTYASENQWEDVKRLSRHAKDLALAAGLPNRAGAALIPLAKAARSEGDLDEGLEATREAIRLLETPVDMTRSGQAFALAAALVWQGEIVGDEDTVSLGRLDEAIAPLSRAYGILEEVARRDPNDSESRSRLFNAAMPLAMILRQRDARAALVLYDHTLSRLKEVPDRGRARRKEILTLAASSYALRALGRNVEARSRLDRAMVALMELKLYPADEIGSELFETLLAVAGQEAATGHLQCAAEILEELVRHMATVNSMTSLDAALDLSHVYEAYAGLRRRAGQTGLASSLDARRLNLWRNWDARQPGNEFIRRQFKAAAN